MTTPTEPSFAHETGSQSAYSSSKRENSPVKLTSFANVSRSENRAGSPSSFSEAQPHSPAESMKSRVRNLADKFESGRNSPVGSESVNSQRNNVAPLPPSKNQIMAQSRPVADRLESFRPKLPGGWESTASITPAGNKGSATGLTVDASDTLDSQAATKPSEPQGKESSTIGQGLVQDPSRSTPKSSSLNSSMPDDRNPPNDPFSGLAAAGNALANAFSASFEPQQEHPSSIKSPQSAIQQQQEMVDADGFASATRPRNVSTNTAFSREASKLSAPSPTDDEASSIMPTPLDKEAQVSPSENSSGYFANQAPPSQPQRLGQIQPTEDTSQSKRQTLPTLATDAKPQYESDRLRKELMRELSPRHESEPTTADSGSPWKDQANLSANTSRTQTHESMILPREYDSYWRGSESEDSSRHQSLHGASAAVKDAMQQYESTPMPLSPVKALPTKPEGLPGASLDFPQNSSARPEMHSHRFSWEDSSMGTPQVPESRFPDSSPVPDTAKPGSHIEEGDQISDQGDGAPSFSHEHKSVLPPESQGAESPKVLQAPPMEDKGANAHLEGQPARPGLQANPVPGTGDQDNDAPPPPSLSEAQPDIQGFRQILAKRDPLDRVRSYNEAREQFAEMDTGLSHWLAVKLQELPEHADVLPYGSFTGPRGNKATSSRAKLGGLLPSGPSTQQPYYQQYLNATPQPASNPGNVPGGGSPQGFSPSGSGGKLSSQQMQAKGKDLLHSAGVFGGKANVAANRLFSKGKSRFKSGNSEKVDK